MPCLEASMRPRVFPAEDPSSRNCASDRLRWPSFNEAAGIPRGRRLRTRWSTRVVKPAGASMRPRVFPAEDADSRYTITPCLVRTSFNEAAGIPRGRRRRWATRLQPPGRREASMRPRVFPAEDHCIPARFESSRLPCGCFNEAAGIPRGRRTARNPLRSNDVDRRIASGRAIASDERSLTSCG